VKLYVPGGCVVDERKTGKFDPDSAMSRGISKSTDFEKAHPSDACKQKNNDLSFSKAVLEFVFSKNTAVMTFEKNGKLIYIWI
jgi:hypothetical protein